MSECFLILSGYLTPDDVIAFHGVN